MLTQARTPQDGYNTKIQISWASSWIIPEIRIHGSLGQLGANGAPYVNALRYKPEKGLYCSWSMPCLQLLL